MGWLTVPSARPGSEGVSQNKGGMHGPVVPPTAGSGTRPAFLLGRRVEADRDLERVPGVPSSPLRSMGRIWSGEGVGVSERGEDAVSVGPLSRR